MKTEIELLRELIEKNPEHEGLIMVAYAFGVSAGFRSCKEARTDIITELKDELNELKEKLKNETQ